MTNNQPVVRSDSFLRENMAQALRLLREADADLIAFQEIDYDGRRSGYVHQLDTIATRLGYAAAAQAVNWDKRYLPFPYGRPAVNFGPMLSGQSLLSTRCATCRRYVRLPNRNSRSGLPVSNGTLHSFNRPPRPCCYDRTDR
jgi:endonuclease/exonuclease/phosphatase family metal-dependent hydrolase